jgi:hypothetical protein
MAINFPNSPATGDTHTSGAKSWTWDGEKWLLNPEDRAFVVENLDGGILEIDEAEVSNNLIFGFDGGVL